MRKRLVADVPLGALLSGGIDSSIVVAVMAQESSGPVRTFSVGFTDARYDERRYARLVAERYGTIHEELVARAGRGRPAAAPRRGVRRAVRRLVRAADLLVCEYARRFVTVALAGDGGDEVFGGYERYRAHALAERLEQRPAVAPASAARALRLLPSARTEPRSTVFRAARFLDTAGLDAGRALRAA